MRSNNRCRLMLWSARFTAVGIVLLAAQSANAAEQCTIESIQAMAPNDATITSVAPMQEPIPHCLIDGYVTTNNPGPNEVGFRLQLPDEGWQQRYYFVGMGGAAGSLPTNSQIPAGNPMLKGFAVAGTDTGHKGDILDWGFLTNEAQALDHVHRGAHVTAVATQQITKQYYGAEDMYRYHSGCSGGGRMGMMSVLTHPEDFDGVLIGAPGGRSSMSMIAFIHQAQQMNREPGSWLSPPKLVMLEQKVTASCDAIDGAEDGIIWDHTKCDFDFSELRCEAGDGPDCLTEPELKSVEAIVEGPIGPNGKLMDGLPVSNISVWAGFLGMVPPPWSDEPSFENMPKSSGGYVIASSLAKVLFGPSFDILTDFDFNDPKIFEEWWRRTDEIQFGKPYSANLNSFRKAGGKIIFWNGVSDPCCLDTDMEQYLTDVAKEIGGKQKLAKFTRMYKIPGMAHCGGGTGPEDSVDRLFEALVDWVETDKKPKSVVARRGENVERLFADPHTGTVSGAMIPPPSGDSREFLLCPHPKVARFTNESGEVKNAGNWTCVQE